MAFLNKISKNLTRFQPLFVRRSSLSSSAAHLPVTILNDEEEAIRDLAARIAREKIAPLVKKMDEESKMDPSIIKAMFDNGFMAMEVDQKYGGTGASFFSSILVIEEIAKVDPSVSVFVDVQNTLVYLNFINYANEQMKDKYFKLMSKDTVGAFCLSESVSGSDAFALQTKAEKKGDYYLLNGTKSWITNAGHAGFYIVFANVDLSSGYKGISAFVVDRNTPGLSIGFPENKLGIRASSTCSVILENVKVPESHILGKIGEGYKYAIQTLNVGRVGIGAQMLGLAEGAFEIGVKYALERKQFGQPVYDFQAMQHQIARVATEIEAARLLVYNAARLAEMKKPIIKEAAMAKFAASEAAANASSKAVEWLAGVGFTKDYPAEKFYRDAKIGAIYEGTSLICLGTIGKAIKSEMK